MIEGLELTIYLDDENISLSLSPTQTEVIFKALGIQIDSENQTMTSFSDSTLKKFILPKVNFTPLTDKDRSY